MIISTRKDQILILPITPILFISFALFGNIGTSRYVRHIPDFWQTIDYLIIAFFISFFIGIISCSGWCISISKKRERIIVRTFFKSHILDFSSTRFCLVNGILALKDASTNAPFPLMSFPYERLPKIVSKFHHLLGIDPTLDSSFLEEEKGIHKMDISLLSGGMIVGFLAILIVFLFTYLSGNNSTDANIFHILFGGVMELASGTWRSLVLPLLHNLHLTQ